MLRIAVETIMSWHQTCLSQLLRRPPQASTNVHVVAETCMLRFLAAVCGMQTPAEGTDANIQNSYLVNKSADGSGDGSLSVLGQVYANFPC